MKARISIAVITGIILLSACAKKPSNRMVNLGGYNLHIFDTGYGKPTVILEYGLSGSGGIIRFADIQKEIASITRVISYERAGIRDSEISPLPRNYENMVKELKSMLTSEKIPPPYILVGASMGGQLIRLYTNTYPEDVVGLVLVDGSHEDFFDSIEHSRTVKEWNEIDSTINSIFSQDSGILHEEWKAFKEGCELMKTIEFPSDIPVHVITSAKYAGTFKAFGLIPDDKLLWVKLQSEWIADNPNAQQIITKNSGHAICTEEPQLVVSVIKDVLNEVDIMY